ncbi:MAG: hypothetical protein M3O70_21585 [Actinomycetota bacterium]|nr:hypothetical protein [Actinomycetota bacterium]
MTDTTNLEPMADVYAELLEIELAGLHERLHEMLFELTDAEHILTTPPIDHVSAALDAVRCAKTALHGAFYGAKAVAGEWERFKATPRAG